MSTYHVSGSELSTEVTTVRNMRHLFCKTVAEYREHQEDNQTSVRTKYLTTEHADSRVSYSSAIISSKKKTLEDAFHDFPLYHFCSLGVVITCGQVSNVEQAHAEQPNL